MYGACKAGHLRFLILNTLCWRLPTFPIKSIIGTMRLNFRVRNENGCDPHVESPTQNIQLITNIVKKTYGTRLAG